MRDRHNLRVLAAIVTAVGLLLPMSTATAEASAETITAETTQIVKIDRAACADLMAMVDAIDRSPVYGPQLRAVIPSTERANLTVDDCTFRTTVSTKVSMRVSTNSYGSQDIGYLREFWQNIGIYQGPFNYAQWHVNVGIVWTGPQTYKVRWGPDCYLTSIPGFIGGYDSGGWCGVYNPHVNWVVQPGSNFWMAPYPGIMKRWAWMRYYAYSNGSTPGAYGGYS
jgi:hypothetical protein